MKNALRFHGFHGRSPGNKEGEFINLMLILRHTTQLPMLARAITQLRTIFLLLLILGRFLIIIRILSYIWLYNTVYIEIESEHHIVLVCRPSPIILTLFRVVAVLSLKYKYKYFSLLNIRMTSRIKPVHHLTCIVDDGKINETNQQGGRLANQYVEFWFSFQNPWKLYILKRLIFPIKF